MSVLHLDTHVIVWLYQGDVSRFPGETRRHLAADRLRYSPMVRVELDYLHQIGRTSANADAVLSELHYSIGLRNDETPFEEVARRAASLSWTRDPFDRLIAAQTIAADARLATKDAALRAGLDPRAIWD